MKWYHTESIWWMCLQILLLGFNIMRYIHKPTTLTMFVIGFISFAILAQIKNIQEEIVQYYTREIIKQLEFRIQLGDEALALERIKSAHKNHDS